MHVHVSMNAMGNEGNEGNEGNSVMCAMYSFFVNLPASATVAFILA